MTLLPHLAARLFGVPLAIHRPKLDVILAVLGPRVGLADLAAASGYTPPTRPTSGAPPGVAVIPIHGTLVRRTVGLEAESGLTSYTGLAAQLDAALANPAVSAILLDIDSPGGEAGGVFDLADRIRAASQIKPVWAVANDMAFSAAYALASAASRVFVSRTGGVGSIGVIAMHVDQSQRDAKEGLHYTAVFAGERKNDLSPHEPLSGQAHAFLHAEVQRIYDLFVDTVARHRGLTPAVVRQTEAGLFFGQAAVSAGLADQVASFDEALAQLLAHLTPLSPPVLSPAAAAAGSTPSLSHRHEEPSMSDENPAAVLDSPASVVAAVPAAAPPAKPQPVTSPATTPALSGADALEIAQLCQLAGRAELTAGFLQAGLPPEQVRSQLLASLAESAPEITSRIAPDAAQPAAGQSNALIQAARQIAAQARGEV